LVYNLSSPTLSSSSSYQHRLSTKHHQRHHTNTYHKPPTHKQSHNGLLQLKLLEQPLLLLLQRQTRKLQLRLRLRIPSRPTNPRRRNSDSLALQRMPRAACEREPRSGGCESEVPWVWDSCEELRGAAKEDGREVRGERGREDVGIVDA
jgi:hypothetical protein